MFDPISFIVVCLALWGILQRTPGVVGEAVDEVQANWGDGTTQPAVDRMNHLRDEGVEPSERGGLRGFLGNVWRDYWHDKDAERQQGRSDARDQPWWRRRFDDAVDRQASRWRGGGPEETADQEPPVIDPAEPGDTPAPDWDDPSPSGGPEPGSGPGPGPGDPPETADSDLPPVRVPSTLGDLGTSHPQPPTLVPGGPTAETSRTATAVLDPPEPQPQIEGNQPMPNGLATNGTQITGVLSGSHEMLSIHHQLNSAIEGFSAQLAAIQRRLHRAGESTLGTVQFSGGSSVMNRMAQSAEAVAALRAAANACGGEVLPLLLSTKREFDKRNS